MDWEDLIASGGAYLRRRRAVKNSAYSRPLQLGLTGGIGAGKSTVANFLKDYFGSALLHLDADQISRELTSQDGEVLALIRRRFTDRVFRGNELDRAVLAQEVFAQPAALRDLEAILHPRIRFQMLAAAQAAGPETEIILFDIPLLVETGWQKTLSEVLVVTAPFSHRLMRLQKRGLDAAAVRARIDAQITDEVRLAHATYHLHNGGTRQDLPDCINVLVQQLRCRLEGCE